MQYLELKEHFKDFTVFSLHDIRKIEPTFHRQRLSEWQKKGYIKKVINGYYVFSDAPVNEPVLFTIANTLYGPSYISFETALSYYHLIPEGVYTITSATSRTTRKFPTTLAPFTYRHIKSELLFGYTLVSYGEHPFKMAEIEKAVLDYLYLNAQLRTPADFEDLRFNTQVFREQVDRQKLTKYLALFNGQALSKRVNHLSAFLRYD